MVDETLSGYSKKKRFKFCSWLTLLVFLVSTFINPAFANVPISSTPTINALNIPKNIGNIKESFQSKKQNSPVVVYIQDAHANYEAQTNISEILKSIHNQYNVNTICVEGMADVADVSLFRAFPFKNAKKTVIDSFVKKGQISAAEEYAINSETKVNLVGVDNKDLYFENVKTYVETVQVQEKAAPFFKEVNSAVAELKERMFSSEFRKFLLNQENFIKNKNKSPLDYTRYLIKETARLGINIENYKTFSILKELEVYQTKVDTEVINKEVSTLINDVLLSELTAKESEALAYAELDYKGERLSAYDYFATIKQLALAHGVDFREYKNINLYLNYLSLLRDINASKLMKERKKIERKIEKKLCLGDSAKDLMKLIKNIKILENIFTLKAIPEEIRYFRNNLKYFTTESILTFFTKYGLKQTAIKIKFSIEKQLPLYKKFYTLAEKREDSFAKKSLKRMKKDKTNATVIVAGGYHTAGLKKRFQKKGITYHIVSPRLTEIPTEDLYRKIMRSYDKYFGVKEGTRGGTVPQFRAIDPSVSPEEYSRLLDELLPKLFNEIEKEIARFMQTRSLDVLSDNLDKASKKIFLALFDKMNISKSDTDKLKNLDEAVLKHLIVKAWSVKVKSKSFMYSQEKGTYQLLENALIYNMIKSRRKLKPEGEGDEQFLVTPISYTNQDSNLAKMKGSISHERVNAALGAASHTFQNYTRVANQRLTKLLSDKDVKAIVEGLDIPVSELCKIIKPDADKIKPLQFILSENSMNSSPTFLLDDRDNYQVAHVGLRYKRVFLSKALVKSFDKDNTTLHDTLLLRELVAYWYADKLWDEGIDKDDAVDFAEGFAEKFEKDFLKGNMCGAEDLNIYVQEQVDNFYRQYDKTKDSYKTPYDAKFQEFLGEHSISMIRQDLPWGYEEHVIDIERSPAAKGKLGKLFNSPAKDGDEYAIVYFSKMPIAIVKKDQNGEYSSPLKITNIAGDEIEKAMPVDKIIEDIDAVQKQRKKEDKPPITSLDVILSDYNFFRTQRDKTPVHERMTLSWRELSRYQRQFEDEKKNYEELIEHYKNEEKKAKVPELAKRASQTLKSIEDDYFNFMKRDGLVLAGGKGLSLSLMDDIVSVPAGFNVTTAAYFKFVQSNKELWETIETELRDLDTMDDQRRDIVAGQIRELMMKTDIPAEIRNEVLTMYRHLNVLRVLSGKDVPTAVAVRSSGIKEDIKVESWLPITSGSQAGQSDTFLNVRGEKNVLDKLREDWASLFTDRAVSYRDDAIFLIWSAKVGLPERQPKEDYYLIKDLLHKYADKWNNLDYREMANVLTTFRNPGSVNLIKAMKKIWQAEIEEDPIKSERVKKCIDTLIECQYEFVHPDEIGIDVVIMQMVQSYLAGVLFNVEPSTRFAGVPQALYPAWYHDDDSLVYKDEDGNITGTKPVVTSFEISYGYGENVVGGNISPDKFVQVTNNGKDWFIIEKAKGEKQFQMIDRELAIALLNDKLPEDEIYKLGAMVADAVSYDEVGKKIDGILLKELYRTKYLKDGDLREGETIDEKKARHKELLKKIAEELADLIKEHGYVLEPLREHIAKYYYVEDGSSPSLNQDLVDKVLKNLVDYVGVVQISAELGKQKIRGYFGESVLGGELSELSNDFMLMLEEAWTSSEINIANRDRVIDFLKMKYDGDEDSEINKYRNFKDLSHVIRSIIDNSFTANVETTANHRNRFSITDEETKKISEMAWKIAVYYQDMRDIEFAIEIDRNAPEEDRIKLYAIDERGKVMMLDGEELVSTNKTPEELAEENADKVILSLYNVQARPYTANHGKVTYERTGTEVSSKFVKEYKIEPMASGTKGENATHAFVVTFDPNKTIAWHADEIRRLQGGHFTAQEKEQIVKMGLDPNDYLPGTDNKLPIALYLLEADPSHDPLMRLVNAVITMRGGDTCHAAIFCREQGIPAVTAVGKIFFDGHLLKQGDGVTVDANNGRIYKALHEVLIDKQKEKAMIPILPVDIKFKPYGVPGVFVKTRNGIRELVDEDGFPITRIGRVIAADGPAKQSSAFMLAPDSDGNSLERAEFKGEKIGINIFAGYGFDLLHKIKAGKVERPEQILVKDFTPEMVKNNKFLSKISNEIFDYFKSVSGGTKAFQQAFGKNLTRVNALQMLIAYDVEKDINMNRVVKMTKIQDQSVNFISQIREGEVRDFLGYIYGVFQRRMNFDYNIIEVLEETHPWIVDDIVEKLDEVGYSTFGDYAGSEFFYFYNLMGYTIAPDQKAKGRAYDFAQDKIRGMIGSEVEGVFAWPGTNPLVGLRGTSLEIEGVDDDFDGNQRVLSFLLEQNIEANKNTKNQSWFYVFVRFVEELDKLDLVLERIAKKKGTLPKEIGIMIEVPANAMIAAKLGKRLLAIKEKYKQYGVNFVFFSFGTNDYAFLAAKGDREDERLMLKIEDPVALKAIGKMKEAGFFYNDVDKFLPLVDEGADIVVMLIEAVTKEAKKMGIPSSLCGEAFTALAKRGDYEKAGRVSSSLDSFGISSPKIRLLASMINHDVRSALKEIKMPKKERTVLFDLSKNGEVFQAGGVIKGDVHYIESAVDFIPESLVNFEGSSRKEQRKFLEMQGLDVARSTMVTFGKIVIVTKNLVAMDKKDYLCVMVSEDFDYLLNEGLIKSIGRSQYVWTNLDVSKKNFAADLEKSKRFDARAINRIVDLWQKAWLNTAKGLESQGIDWDDLQYANAIIVDSDVSMEGWDVFTADKGIVPQRIKAKVAGISTENMRKILNGKTATLDCKSGKIYEGNLPVFKKKQKLQSLPIPEHNPIVVKKNAIESDTKGVYKNMKYHPLFLMKYDTSLEKMISNLGESDAIFSEWVNRVSDDLDAIKGEQNALKKKLAIAKLERKLNDLNESFIVGYVGDALELALQGKDFLLNVDSIKKSYFENVHKDITKMLGGSSVDAFIKNLFLSQMKFVLEANQGDFVVHTTTSLNSAEFYKMKGGFLVEQVNPNPDYGLLGGARSIADFTSINRIELDAFKEVWQALPEAERKNFGLQIAEIKGTQSGAVVIAWAELLKELGLIPSKELQVGLRLASPTDSGMLNTYFDFMSEVGDGLSFVTYDKFQVGAAWAGVDIYWNEWRRLGRPESIADYGDIAEKMILGHVENADSKFSALKYIVVFADSSDVQSPLMAVCTSGTLDDITAPQTGFIAEGKESKELLTERSAALNLLNEQSVTALENKIAQGFSFKALASDAADYLGQKNASVTVSLKKDNIAVVENDSKFALEMGVTSISDSTGYGANKNVNFDLTFTQHLDYLMEYDKRSVFKNKGIKFAEENIYHALICNGGDSHQEAIEAAKQKYQANFRWDDDVKKAIEDEFGYTATREEVKAKGWSQYLHRAFINQTYQNQLLTSLPLAPKMVQEMVELLGSEIDERQSGKLVTSDEAKAYVKAFVKMLITQGQLDPKREKEFIDALVKGLEGSLKFQKMITAAEPSLKGALVISRKHILTSAGIGIEMDFAKYDKVIIHVDAGSKRYEENIQKNMAKELGVDKSLVSVLAVDVDTKGKNFGFLRKNLNDQYDYVDVLGDFNSRGCGEFEQAIKSAWNNPDVNNDERNFFRLYSGSFENINLVSNALSKVKKVWTLASTPEKPILTSDAKKKLGFFDQNLIKNIISGGVFAVNEIKKEVEGKLKAALLDELIHVYA